MPTLLMLKGLPASGKSTYAKELVEKEGYVRVNKDDLRAMMHNGEWSKENEGAIIRMRDEIVLNSLLEDKNVVVDDTNFAPIHKQRLQELMPYGTEFQVKLIDTPLEECISRNERRANKVPLNVITDMYNKYLEPEVKEVEYNDELDEAIIVDVDGTLAHMHNRSPYDASLAMGDTLDDAVSSIVNMAYGHGYKVIVLTGRHSGHLQVTKDWLEEKGVNYDEIYCRQEGDNSKDTEVKSKLYNEHVRNKYNVKYIIDDRPSVCRMWRALGLKVLQVGDPHKEF